MVGMHAGAHLDEVKPEGVENEAVEGAFIGLELNVY